MTGGGFGGCTINLVEASQTESFRARIAARYEEAFQIRPDIRFASRRRAPGVWPEPRPGKRTAE